jgi:hypothetical protein
MFHYLVTSYILCQLGTLENSMYFCYYFNDFVIYNWSLKYYTTYFLELALETGQDLKKITFKDQSWLGLKTRSRKFNSLLL